MAETVPKIKLNNGKDIPMIGLGTWKSKPGEIMQAIKDAIDIGYRHIDGAFFYNNEKEIGQAIADKINEGVVTREDLFIVSKLWQTFHDVHNVEKGLRKSLNDLGLDYLDLYLIHYPVGFMEGDRACPFDENGKILTTDVDYVDTWIEMEKLVENGLVKSIGVSNFNHEQIQRILDNARIKPVINQVECHPYLNQNLLSDWMSENDIILTSYSPLGSPDRPMAKPEDKVLLSDTVLLELSIKYNKTPAQILLRYHIERGFIVLPKSVKKHRLEENFDIFDFNISSEDMEALMILNCNERYLKFDAFGTDHKYYPFSIEF